MALHQLPSYIGGMAVLRTSSRVPPGHRLYAIGDIHGRADLLAALLSAIATDAREGAAAACGIVYLGDYVDRGPQSAAVIDLVLDAAPKGFALVTLMGNHEEMMRRFLAGEVALGRTWMMNGGGATLESYGVEAPGWFDDDADFGHARAALAAHLPPRHRDFLDRLKLTHEAGDYLFVHAGVRPGVALAEQQPEDLLWIRDEFLDSGETFEKRIVHGHSIAAQPVIQRNRIGIDTGAYASGTLTALVLEGAEWRLLQT